MSIWKNSRATGNHSGDQLRPSVVRSSELLLGIDSVMNLDGNLKIQSIALEQGVTRLQLYYLEKQFGQLFSR